MVSCFGTSYDPQTQYCSKDKKVLPLSECHKENDEITLYNPETQYCDESEGRKNLWNCGGKMIKQEQYCFTTTENPNTLQVEEKPFCDVIRYNRLTHYCFYNKNGGQIRLRRICYKNPSAKDSLNIDLRVDSLDAYGHNGQMCDTHDYQIYKTVQIGQQVWMAQNMNYQTGNSWCYNDKPENCDKYGRLYDWNTATEVCPEGWHLPKKEALDSLIGHVGGGNLVSAKINLKSKDGWKDSQDGEDSYGFNAIPAGYRDNADGLSKDEGFYADAWSASVITDNQEEYAWFLSIGYHNGDTKLMWYGDKKLGLPVRCQKDKLKD